MKLLLDTHVALWATLEPERLRPGEARLIRDADTVFVSVATLSEIAIKHKLQRGSPNDMPVSGKEALSLFQDAGYTILPVAARHAVAVDDLERRHGDPFDRMLVAQALTEPMRLLTRDVRLQAYGGLITVA